MKIDIKVSSHQKNHLTTLLLFFFFFSVSPAFAQNKCDFSLPSLRFQSGTFVLTNTAKKSLSEAAIKLKANPFCSVFVQSYSSTSKSGQSICAKRLDRIRLYLIEVEGISADRIMTACDFNGDPNITDLKTQESN